MKPINKNLVRQFYKLIKHSNSIFITGHQRPDGDTIGSSLALFWGIEKIASTIKKNIKVDIVMKETFPFYFNFLPGIKKINVCNKTEKKYDLGIILECSKISRIGNLIDLKNLKTVVNIDHHDNHSAKNGSTSDEKSQTINHKSQINLIYPEYSACAELIFDIFTIWKIKLDKRIATCLYTGIVTDTGKFQWSNTKPHTFNTSEKLLNYGVQPLEIYKHIYAHKSYNSMLLLSKVLNTIKIVKIKKYQITYVVVTKAMFESTNTTAKDTEEFINFPVSVSGTDIALFFREDKKDTIKVSFRSEKINVEKIARYWSGGGHIYASGATVNGKMQKVIKEVLEYLKSVLK